MRGPLAGLFARSNPLLQSLILGQLATVLGAFLINVLSARAMGPDNRGEIALILQVSYLAGALIPLGRDRAILQSYGRGDPKPKADSVLATLSRLPIVILILCSSVFAVWRLGLSDPPTVVLGFILLLCGNLASRFFRSEAILENRGAIYLVATLVGQVGLVTAGGSLLVVGEDAVGPWLLAYGLSLSIPFLSWILIRGRKPMRARGRMIQDTRALGIRLLPSMFVEMGMTKTDKLLLPLLSSYSTLGYYSVAVSLIDFSILPFRQFIDSRIPRWARMVSAGELKLLQVIIRPLLFALIFVISIAALAYATIPYLFGSEYIPALQIIPWLSLASFSHIVTLLLAGVATAVASAKTLSRMYLLGILCSLPLHLILIPAFGASGAAIAQSAGFLTSAFFGMLLVRQTLNRKQNGNRG